jgi:hypothetical protein
MAEWNYCCNNQKIVFVKDELRPGGAKIEHYRCLNYPATHTLRYDKDGRPIGKRTDNIAPGS